MSIKKIAQRAAIAVAAAGLVIAGFAAPAHAAETTTPGFRGGFWPADAGDGILQEFGKVYGWTEATIALAKPENSTGNQDMADERFTFSHPDTTQAFTFIAPRGKEHLWNEWNAFEPIGLRGPGAPGIWLPTINFGAMSTPGNGSPAGNGGVRAAGGEYSVGIAFTKFNGIHVSPDGMFFQHIIVEPGSGDWRFDPVQPPAGHVWGQAYGEWDPTLRNGAGGWKAPTAAPEGGSFTSNVEADVVEDVTTPPTGKFELSAPANATARIGDAKIVDGQSVSTGKLGQFSVTDDRVELKGWELTTAVEDFKKAGSEDILKSALGVKPVLVTPVAGVTAGAEQVAGSAIYPSTFAEAAAGAARGKATFDADLTFKAPKGADAGTYTSKLTMTLVSK
ncbi:hypothetical protein [Microbacterium album]|uniref:WxL domain-containing protein n=1 Tax=Microbacterium album TaxID=2053191 RepID=A0A917MMK9_9MICO|nr:hypothetical protein [Microbacterium album]GGH47839.1 hypothetical protein GCM10010921_24870 [Microbacterium album]